MSENSNKQKLNISTLPDRPYDAYMNRAQIAPGQEDGTGFNPYAIPDPPMSTNADGTTAYGQAFDTYGNAVGSSSNGNVSGVPIKTGQNLGDVWIQTFIKSTNWQPKSQGFWIDGPTGYAEFSNVFVSGNIQALTGNIGGFVIGADYIADNDNNFGLSSAQTGGDDVRFWAGSSLASKDTAPFRVTESGNVFANNITFSGTILGSPNLTTANLTSSFNSSVQLIRDVVNTSLNTNSKQILQGFTFDSTSYAGAFKTGTITWSTSTGAWVSGSGIVINARGIVGANGSGVTFSIDTSGNAVFGGTLQAASGTFGTITSGTITGVGISGSTITGGIVQTASSGQRIVLNGSLNSMFFTNSGGTTIASMIPYVSGSDNGVSVASGSSLGRLLVYETSGVGNAFLLANGGFIGVSSSGNSSCSGTFTASGMLLTLSDVRSTGNIVAGGPSSGTNGHLYGHDAGGSGTAILNDLTSGTAVSLIHSRFTSLATGTTSTAVPSPSGGGTVDTQARNAVNQLIAVLKYHGLIQ